ncbi:MAG: substrate-binding domain-containing protein [Propionibacteriaceae bacterium]|jgi:phosphate transport system substrate-binding protein|nr:substrate-binding domain-containing protein [Propionibacteriaceae bacterium]
MKAHRFLIVVVAIVLALSGCTPGKEPPVTPAGRPTLTDAFIERIDGSTATIPLMSAALRFLRGTDYGLLHTTTPMAYYNLIHGEKDVIFVTPPSEEELAEAKEAGVELEIIPIVKDALVFLVNTANPVNGLTDAQLQAIYTGEVTNWAEVGGDDLSIIPYQREINSGSQTLFLQLAMRDVTPMDAPLEWRPASMGQLVDVIAQYDNSPAALGYSVFYYTQQMYVKDTVELLAIDGVAPSNQTISDDSYRYGTHYYAVVRSDEPANSPARQLIAWMLSDEAQQLASANAYVPLDPANIVPAQADYGYFGSTPENTSQSIGTGGPRDQRAPDFVSGGVCGLADDGRPLDCLDDRDLATPQVTIPGYPAAQAAVQAWIDQNPVSELERWYTQSGRGLFVIEYGRNVEGRPLPLQTAVFRLSDGQQLGLSDLFYDGVNYVSLINQHLLDPGTNQALVRCSTYRGCWPGESASNFTGIPADYPAFGLRIDTGELYIQFPLGNPFLISETSAFSEQHDVRQPIMLAADLSPYGDYWRVDSVQIGSTFVEHLSRDYTGTNPIDTILNRNIDAFAAEIPQAHNIAISEIVNGKVVIIVYMLRESPDDGTETYFDYHTGDRL